MLCGVGDTQPGVDRRAQRHDGRTADVLESTRQHRGVVGVGQHDEAVIDQSLCGPAQFGGVGRQRALVGDVFEADPVRAASTMLHEPTTHLERQA
jgi:hypothetical protein